MELCAEGPEVLVLLEPELLVVLEPEGLLQEVHRTAIAVQHLEEVQEVHRTVIAEVQPEVQEPEELQPEVLEAEELELEAEVPERSLSVLELGAVELEVL